MPNVDAEALIASKLGELPDPDNSDRTFMFLPYAQFPGQHEEHQQLIEANKQRTARALVLMLENHGKTIVDVADITPPPALGSNPVVGLYCSSCAGLLLQTTEKVDREGKLSIPPHAINPDCGTQHGAA